jgi:hypothetical protein
MRGPHEITSFEMVFHVGTSLCPNGEFSLTATEWQGMNPENGKNYVRGVAEEEVASFYGSYGGRQFS